jgi:hypothetical protein
MRFPWKATSLREFRTRSGTDATDAIIRKLATRRCRDHPDFAIRLSAEGGNLWIDACCRRAAHVADAHEYSPQLPFDRLPVALEGRATGLLAER